MLEGSNSNHGRLPSLQLKSSSSHTTGGDFADRERPHSEAQSSGSKIQLILFALLVCAVIVAVTLFGVAATGPRASTASPSSLTLLPRSFAARRPHKTYNVDRKLHLQQSSVAVRRRVLDGEESDRSELSSTGEVEGDSFLTETLSTTDTSLERRSNDPMVKPAESNTAETSTRAEESQDSNKYSERSRKEAEEAESEGDIQICVICYERLRNQQDNKKTSPASSSSFALLADRSSHEQTMLLRSMLYPPASNNLPSGGGSDYRTEGDDYNDESLDFVAHRAASRLRLVPTFPAEAVSRLRKAPVKTDCGHAFHYQCLLLHQWYTLPLEQTSRQETNGAPETGEEAEERKFLCPCCRKSLTSAIEWNDVSPVLNYCVETIRASLLAKKSPSAKDLREIAEQINYSSLFSSHGISVAVQGRSIKISAKYCLPDESEEYSMENEEAEVSPYTSIRDVSLAIPSFVDALLSGEVGVGPGAERGMGLSRLTPTPQSPVALIYLAKYWYTMNVEDFVSGCWQQAGGHNMENPSSAMASSLLFHIFDHTHAFGEGFGASLTSKAQCEKSVSQFLVKVHIPHVKRIQQGLCAYATACKDLYLNNYAPGTPPLCYNPSRLHRLLPEKATVWNLVDIDSMAWNTDVIGSSVSQPAETTTTNTNVEQATREVKKMENKGEASSSEMGSTRGALPPRREQKTQYVTPSSFHIDPTRWSLFPENIPQWSWFSPAKGFLEASIDNIKDFLSALASSFPCVAKDNDRCYYDYLKNNDGTLYYDYLRGLTAARDNMVFNIPEISIITTDPVRPIAEMLTTVVAHALSLSLHFDPTQRKSVVVVLQELVFFRDALVLVVTPQNELSRHLQNQVDRLTRKGKFKNFLREHEVSENLIRKSIANDQRLWRLHHFHISTDAESEITTIHVDRAEIVKKNPDQSLQQPSQEESTRDASEREMSMEDWETELASMSPDKALSSLTFDLIKPFIEHLWGQLITAHRNQLKTEKRQWTAKFYIHEHSLADAADTKRGGEK